MPYKKIIVFVLLIEILYSPFSLVFETKKVRALPAAPVIDVAAGIILTDIAINTSATLIPAGTTAVSTGSSLTKSIIQFALKLAGQMLKKLVLDRLVDSFINFINRGYKGAVIQDWGKFWEQAGNDAVGMLAQSMSATAFLCEPFNLNVQMMLIPQKQFTQEVTCSLDKIVGNLESFKDNFVNGNWVAYQELWYPQNNFYGATIFTWAEAKYQQNKAVEAAKSEGIAGGGFLAKTKCDANGQNCVTTYPGSIMGDLAKKALVEIPTNSIINADDIANYVTAIANAAINQLLKGGIEGLQGLGKKGPATIPANPCAGASGEELRVCQGLIKLQQADVVADRTYFVNQINSTLEPRKKANDSLETAIKDQTDYVGALEDLANCQPTTINNSNLTNEQQTLDELQNKFDDNFTFIEQLEKSLQEISNSTDVSAITISFSSIQPLLDPTAAQNTLTDAQAKQKQIQENVALKLQPLISTLHASNCPTGY